MTKLISLLSKTFLISIKAIKQIDTKRKLINLKYSNSSDEVSPCRGQIRMEAHLC